MIPKIFGKKETIEEQFLNELLNKDYDEEKLSHLLYEDGVDINHLNEKAETFLHICMKKRKYKSAIWLIKHNANIHLKDQRDQDALALAMEHENHKIVQLLLSLGEIDINKKDSFGRTVLQDTVVLGDNEMAELLIKNGADINIKDNQNRNVIFDALSYGNVHFIDFLLSVDGLELNNVDINGDTIMHHPQVIQSDEIALKLIEAGADPTIKNKDGKTYLCDIALKGEEFYHIVEKAVENGADINSRVGNQNTILMELVSVTSRLTTSEIRRRESLTNVSKKLLLHGLDVNAIDANGETALFRAIKVKDIELVKFLVSAKANPNIQNEDGQTALGLVAFQGRESIDILIVLLKAGASPNIRDNKNRTLYECLNDMVLHTHGKKEIDDPYLLSKLNQDGNYMHVLKTLFQYNNTNLNYLDSEGNPLFFKPILYDHFLLFRLYIRAGVNIHSVNAKNHNIFYEYVYKVFKDDNLDIEFQNNVSALISAKVDHNYQDETGWKVVDKIMETSCNVHLFDILTNVVLFDYKLTDKLGRSVMHTGVWFDQQKIIRRIHQIDPSVVNIPDNYGILPITYAALLGSQEMVLLFISLNANVKSGVHVPPRAIRKFTPLLKNLDKLTAGVEDEDILRKMNIVIDQVKRDFLVIKD